MPAQTITAMPPMIVCQGRAAARRPFDRRAGRRPLDNRDNRQDNHQGGRHPSQRLQITFAAVTNF
jgi:hypothetical protein